MTYSKKEIPYSNSSKQVSIDSTHFALYDLQHYLNNNPAVMRKPHIHNFFQVIWFKRGHGNHFVDFKAYEVKDNAIFFIAKNQAHYFDTTANCTGIILQFNEAFLVQKDSEIDFFIKCNLFNNPYKTPSCCIGNKRDAILDSYITLIQEELNYSDTFGKDELLRMYLKSFLVQVQRCKNAYEKQISGPIFPVDEKRKQLVRFNNLVEAHYKNGLTVADYASRLNISTRTLADITNTIVGKSPSIFIQERIVLEAQRMLLHSELHINQIAYNLGFEDASYFVKYFKRHTQLSPSAFRNSIS
ncbi:helix-turn-helix domain-containing protein [Sphingobacterium sp. Mn56C]|uniref:AraC family transcriptional regulator n=1 Tax=Sphingobacterium sp. Mn56C TaxID=3395261 RepID=UPI003BE8FE53